MPTSLATLRRSTVSGAATSPGTALLLTAAVALTGCAGFSTVAPTTVSTAATHVMTGSVHGGQQPVVGAHVHLYEVGAAGYGSASTNIITTADGSDADGNYVLTDASGNFSLPVTPATSSYTCTNANNQTYLLATGGNPGFADPATNNTAITLMAVLGTCGNIVNLPNAVINEISTVAAVTALQQFIVDPIHIGTSAGNQPGLVAGTGLALDLVPIATGVASTVNGAGTGVTPQAKVNTLGDILAPCINSTGPGSSDCTKLFTAVTPSGGTQPTDVASAMLLLAENPGLNIAALYGLPNAAAPFQPTLSAAPNDFALSVTYTGGGLTAPINVVIDASGNAWMADCPSCNKLAGTDKIVGISPAGIFQSGAGGYTAGIHKPEGLAFDGAGNLWSTDDRSGATPDQVVKMTGGTVDFAFNDSNISTPIGIAIDASNNAWVANQTFSGLAVKISPSGSDIATASDPGNTYFPTGIGIDGTGAIYMAGTGSGTVLKFTSAGKVTYDSSNGVSQPIGISIDASGDVLTINNDSSQLTKLYGTSGDPAFSNADYISNASQVSVDGLSTYWIADCPGQGCGANAGNVLHISNAGAIVGTGNGLQDPHLSNPTASAIDSTGNLWVTNSLGASVTEFLGVAAPVKTPLAVATSTGALGTRP